MNRPDELGVPFFHRAVLIAKLGENLCKGWQPDPQFGLQRQDHEREIRSPGQGTKVL
jgi:hypothetical protein